MRDDLVLILDSLRNTWVEVIGYLPRFLISATLLIVGWLVARLVRSVVVRLLRFLRVETVAERTGVDDFLLRGGVRFTLVTLIGEALYWSVLLVFVMAVLNLLGPNVGPELGRRIGSSLPSIGLSLLVFVLGLPLARFIRGLLETYLNNIGAKSTAAIALLVHGALLLFVAILALEQLGIATTLLVSAFQLAFGGVCLALALAFGLGGRRWAESLLERSRR